MTLSLKHKAYIVVALTMLIVAGSSMALGRFYFAAERNRVLDARRRVAEATAAELDNTLGRGLARLRTVAALPALAYGLQSQERAREARQIPAWTTLHYLFYESDVFTGGVVLLNRDGHIIWSEPSDLARIDTPYPAWDAVRASLAREPDADHVFLARPDGNRNDLLVAASLVDQQNERVGVLVGAVPTSNPAVVAALSHGRPSDGGSTHLVDATGVVLASTSSAAPGQQLRYWQPSDRDGRGSVGARQGDQDEVLAAVAPIPVAGWRIVTEERTADALAGVRELGTLLWMASGVFTVVLAGMLLFVVISFTRPVEVLTTAAQRIRGGDLQSAFRLDRRDELGQLADALNDMTRSLQRQAAELERTTALAEAASRAKTEFLAKVSHEIRTPMNGVLGMTELLLGTALSPGQRQFATTIQRSADSLLTLINDILDFSKIEAGRLELERVAFSVRDVVRDALELLGESAASKGLHLSTEIAPADERTVWGDVVRVRQILTNLTANAIKFTERGEVVVRVRVVEETGTHSHMRFEVRDTGIGIDAANRERVFEPFVQTDSSTTRLYGGTGLGLAITRDLTAKMHGTCGVESEPGKGSTFWFQIPFERAAVDRPHSEAAVEPAASAPEPATPPLGLRVLLVEDNVVNIMVAQMMLANLGCQVRTAMNGVQALEMFAAEPFDVVLMDRQMPEMGGEDATRELRRREAGQSRVPVIAVTASALPGDRDVCLAAGMDDILTKPYTQAALRATIEHWVAANAAAATGPRQSDDPQRS